MHGIIAMSRELQDLIEPSSNVNDAIDIISSTAPDTFSSHRTRHSRCLTLALMCPSLRGASAVAGERHPRL
jgi:hypothetical protein